MDELKAWAESVVGALNRFSLTPHAPVLDLEWLVLNMRSVNDAFGLNEVAKDLCDFARETPGAVLDEILEVVPVGADNSFHSHLLRLEAFARRIPGAPQWTSVVVSGVPLTAGQTTVRVERRVLKTPLEYAIEFKALLARGYPWINLHATGLLGDGLLIEVDHAALGHLGCRSSVNLAGPESATLHTVGWQLGDRLTVVD